MLLASESLSVSGNISYSYILQISCVYGHVLQMISGLIMFAVQKARDVFELNRGVEWRRRYVTRAVRGNLPCSKLKRLLQSTVCRWVRVPAQASQEATWTHCQFHKALGASLNGIVPFPLP